MQDLSKATCLGSGCGGRNFLVRSESADLRRLTDMVGKIFRTPVAYAAMLGHRDRVMTRIGSGSEHWKHLRTFPLRQYLSSTIAVLDVQDALPEGTNLGQLKFMASAPIHTLCGQRLGVLVIADLVPRPEFSEPNLETLAELAAVIANRIEIGMIASQSMESRLQYDEAETRFRDMANRSDALIACNGADGSCEFVNEAWLRFTGRQLVNEQGDGWQQAIHERHRERVLNRYWQALQTRDPFNLEVPMGRLDGVFRCMRGNGIPRFMKDGSFAGFVVWLIDESAYNEPFGETADLLH